jgi:hypothetical protein
MNWNAYILNLLDRGYTPEEIVEEANNPFITLKYIQDIIFTNRRKNASRGRVLFKNPKEPGILRLHAYCLKVGKERFEEELKATTYKKMAKRFDTTESQVMHFFSRFVRERDQKPYMLVGKFANYERQLIAQGKMKPKVKQTKIQDIQNLW